MSYTKTTGEYQSEADGFTVKYYVYTPEKPPMAIVQLVHGMCEYIERYEEFASYLCDNGIVVCGCDNIGHGGSINDESELGWFGEKDGDTVFAADVNSLYNIMRKKYRHLPYILFGHSMGSFIVRDYITTYNDTVDGAVICGTAQMPKKIGMGIFLTKLLCKLHGTKYRKPSLASLATGAYNDRFKSGGENAWLTRDTEIRNKYNGDKLCGFPFTVGGYRDMLTLLKRVNMPEWAQGVPQSLPVLVVSGEEDPVGDFGEGVRNVYGMLDDAELCNIELKLYPGCRHEILNEINREEIFADLLEWIRATAKGAIECRTM